MELRFATRARLAAGKGSPLRSCAAGVVFFPGAVVILSGSHCIHARAIARGFAIGATSASIALMERHMRKGEGGELCFYCERI